MNETATLIIQYILLFFFYSAVGWLGESIYCSVRPRKWVNRGFLTGPLCPIYGTGTIVMAVALMPLTGLDFGFSVHENYFSLTPLLVFVAGMLLCDIVEFITSVIMEKLFHARWWDYSNKKFNIQGRICLTHTFYWGIAAVLFIYFVHPIVMRLASHFSPITMRIVLVGILFVFIIDLINAVKNAMDVRKLMDRLGMLGKTIEHAADEITERFDELQKAIDTGNEKINEWQTGVSEEMREVKSQLESSFRRVNKKGKLKTNRLYVGYPELKEYTKKQLHTLEELLSQMKEKFNYKK